MLLRRNCTRAYEICLLWLDPSVNYGDKYDRPENAYEFELSSEMSKVLRFLIIYEPTQTNIPDLTS